MTDATTHLFRGNAAGEILDDQGKVVGRIVPVEPTEAMTERGFHAFIAAHDIAFRQNEPTAPIYKHMLSAAPADWSAHAVRVPERVKRADNDWHPLAQDAWNAALDAIMGGREMSDRELLELAAKAAGHDGMGTWDDEWQCLTDHEGWMFDPLTDDGDLFGLARACKMIVDFDGKEVRWQFDGEAYRRAFTFAQCGGEAMAIVMAAAEIGAAK